MTAARVIVAGGGVAALEACFALDALAGDRVRVVLLAPNAFFTHRPAGVRDPLAVSGLARVPLAHLAVAAGAELRADRLAAVDPEARRVTTEAGYELPYDALVVATGAVPRGVPAAAVPLHLNAPGCRLLIRHIVEGRIGSLVFVEPAAPTWPFDLYDLAIDVAVTLRRQRRNARLTLVTAGPAPLAILGLGAAGLLAGTLGAHGIAVVESAHVAAIGRGVVEIQPLSRRACGDAVIAAPRLRGRGIRHLPFDRDGFLPVDVHGRVADADDVLAAGDCTAFPVKHPSLAAQQADAAAEWIAAEVGAPVEPAPFVPVLRGILPSRLRWYVEVPLAGGDGDATRVSASPLWSPELRFHARFLEAHLVLDHDHGGAELAPRVA